MVPLPTQPREMAPQPPRPPEHFNEMAPMSTFDRGGEPPSDETPTETDGDDSSNEGSDKS
jgi:hypothetical protein